MCQGKNSKVLNSFKFTLLEIKFICLLVYLYLFLSKIKNIKKNLNYPRVLATPGDISKSIIKSANNELKAAICECVQNVCNGNVKIDC